MSGFCVYKKIRLRQYIYLDKGGKKNSHFIK